MFKVKEYSYLFLKLVSSLVIATSHLLFQISKIVSEPHLIIRWRQCSNDLDLKTLCMDMNMLCLNSILYILIHVCSLLVFIFLHILSRYRKLSRDIYIYGHWTLDNGHIFIFLYIQYILSVKLPMLC